MTIFTAILFGERYQLQADFRHASSPIQLLYTDDDDEIRTTSTPFQVADFRHEPEEAMRYFLEESIRDGCDEPIDFAAEISHAIKTMTRDD